MKMSNKFFEAIKELTSYNEHTKAYICGCFYIQRWDLINELKEIQAVQDRVGCLPEASSAKRFQIYQEMKRTAQQKLKAEEYKEFYMLF